MHAEAATYHRPVPTNNDAQPMFYGRVMLGVAVAMAFATLPAQTVLVSLWKEPLGQSLNLSLAQVAGAYSIATVIAGLPLPLVGRLADRFGLKRTALAVSIGLTLSLILLREASGIIALGVGFFCVRFLGQGSLGMLAGHTVAMWYERKLGRAHSILAVCGFAAGSAIMPQPTAWLLEHTDWRTTLLALAGLSFLLTVPAILILYRNRPEEIGQHLDGDPEDHHTDAQRAGANWGFTLRQTVRFPAYWILMAHMVTAGFIGTALIFHMPAMLQQAGLEGTTRQAALTIQPWPIVFGLSTLGVGILTDRFHPARLLPTSLLFLIAGIACNVGALAGLGGDHGTIPLMAVGMALHGVNQAIVVAVCSPTIARYFGRKHHGAIRGTVSTAGVIGTGMSPFAIAWAYQLANDSFIPAYIACAALTIPLGISACMLREPPRPEPGRRTTDDIG